MTSLLEDPNTYLRFDPTRLRDRIADLPDQCRRAWDEGLTLPLPDAYADVQAVVVMGMGGSAAGGDLIADLALLEQGPPISVVRDYSLPSWIGAGALAIVSSYSGNTEETTAMYHQAQKANAKVLAVTGGGTLAELTRQDGVPTLQLAYQGEPRSALGYSFIAPLAFLCKLRLLEDKASDLAEAMKILRDFSRSLAPDTPQSNNPAKQVASFLHGMLPVIYGAGFLSSVARRWKTQLNENSKVWAFAEVLPELDHNAAQGLALPSEVTKKAAVVLLHSSLLHSRLSFRYRVTQELLAQEGVRHHRIEATGWSPLAHLLGTVMLGDFVSYYLAMLNHVDPAATPALDWVKEQISRA